MNQVVIIGGGASGIVSGIFAAREDNEVIILERNSECLKKILVTGNGKCNFLNESYSINNYHSKNIDIVDRIISSENINLVKDFFDNIGVVSKVKNGCYYPFSNQATSIKNCLISEALRVGVKIINNCLVTDIRKDGSGFRIVTDKDTYKCSQLVLASGSFAYPKTGSDGMGYSFLEKFGHSIIKPLPALVQLKSNFKYLKDWSGVRTDVELRLFEDGKCISQEEGEVQLTDYGISGICTFNLSHYVTRGLDEGRHEVIKINFVPFIDTLVTPWIDQYMKKVSNKSVGEALEGILNYKLVNIILKVNNISSDKYYIDLTKDEKFNLIKSLKSFEIEIIGSKSFDSAQVCNGGVSLLEINPVTMESLLIDNLYIIGELLDVNGNCGGYNLTNCWISGMLAGKSIGDKCDKS
ncbi:MAG: aminoacetone oxidase family FAD-binding enzyme [Bacilli bacterium]|nr:aminoacetone oxidase family FAD-binding enzyme [Bacilli bacterium]